LAISAKPQAAFYLRSSGGADIADPSENTGFSDILFDSPLRQIYYNP
jgi:hypothetical protein